MELVVLLIVVGLVAAAVIAGAGVVGRRRRTDRGEPAGPEGVTDTSVPPPAEPSEPVPGSVTDRARKGHTDDEVGSRVVRDRA